jgi:hypothetical protein
MIIALLMEAVRMSETSVCYETTRRNIPEGYHLHTRRRENLKFLMPELNSDVVFDSFFFWCFQQPCQHRRNTLARNESWPCRDKQDVWLELMIPVHIQSLCVP